MNHFKAIAAMSLNQPDPAANKTRIPELDGIRGLAISLVLYEHFVGRSITGTGWLADILQKLRFLGGSGVDLFFVLSGFLIGGILMDHRSSENYFKAFYARRCCRILPAYLLTLGAYLALKLLLTAHASEEWFAQLFLQGDMPFWAYLTFTQNLVKALTFHVCPDWLIVTWSLVVEEQFYLILPLALWLLKPSHIVKAALVFICLNPLFQLYLCIWHPVASETVGNILPLPGDALLLGVVCAYLLRQNRLHSWLAQNRQILNAILIILLAGTACLIPIYSLTAFEYERILVFHLWLAMFYAGLLLVTVISKDGMLAAAMRFPPLCRLGTISYGLYLFHLPINGLLHGLLLGRDCAFRGPLDVFVSAAALGISLIFAGISWHFLEKPIVAWGHSFLYGKARSNPGQ